MHALALLTCSGLLLACGGAAGPDDDDDARARRRRGREAVTAPCDYAFKALYLVSNDPLQAEALVEADRATTLLDAGDPATAARRFLGCAAVLRQAPEGDAQANQNAEICYYNAGYAFATAGAWAREGRALLEEAAGAEQAATAAYIRAQLLAAPPRDCPQP
jgi:hypothetical protein